MCERIDDPEWIKQTGFEDDEEEDGMGGIAVAGEGALDRLSIALSTSSSLLSLDQELIGFGLGNR